MGDETLESYFECWLKKYTQATEGLDLFNPEKVSQLTHRQRVFLVRALYHVRGHFLPFICLVGSVAPGEEKRRIVLDNLGDEFGNGASESHEMLYRRFAQVVGAGDILDEILTQAHYLPFARAFVEKQFNAALEKAMAGDTDWVWAAFAAIEALDNIDYQHQLKMAAGLKVPVVALEFFAVHAQVTHFAQARPALEPTWERDPRVVKDAAQTMGELQSNVWQKLNDAVFESPAD